MSSIFESLLQKHNNGDVFSRGDFLDCFNFYEFSDFNIHCLCLDENIEFIPSLCFSWINNQFYFYKRIKNIKDELSRREIAIPRAPDSKAEYEVFTGNNFQLIVENFNKSYLDKIKEFLKCCDILREGSLNVRNHERDNLNIILTKIINSVAITSDFKGPDLARLISESQNIQALHFYVLPDNTIRTDIKLIDGKDLLIKLLKNEYKEYVLECRKFGRPITWKCYDLEKVFYYCLIPITVKYGKTRFVTEFILLWDERYLNIEKINNVVEIVDTYSSQGLVYKKINPLINIQREAIENINAPFYRSKKEFLSKFSVFIKKCLFQITNTTYAHSATVRLYDSYDKSLHLFKEVSTDWAKQKITSRNDDYSRIKIKSYKSSLNAFTFLINSSKHSYSYIRNLHKRIPPEYSSLGLKQILKRRDSLSEICFPLLCGDIPFGTLNIESVLKNAFEHDIDYLIGIKQAIDAFYEISHKSNDSIWLSGRSPVYRNVHELSQLLRLEEKIFTDEQTDVLQRLIMIDDTVTLSNRHIPLSKLRQDLIDWLTQNVNSFTLNYLMKNFVFDLKGTLEVTFDVYEKLLVICKNIFDNIIDHGDPKRDKFFLVENDHLRMGKNANLKIFVKTFGCFDLDIFDDLLISPIQKDNEYHYGMFLIGMLARRLGGIAQLSQGADEYSPHTILEIALNI